MAGDRPELLEHRGVAAERAADDREAVAARENHQVSGRIVERVSTEAAALVSVAGVDAVVAVEWIADDAGHAGLAVELAPVEEGQRAGLGSEKEGAVVEKAHAPVRTVLQVEVEEVEVRVRRHRLERGD